MEDDDTICPIDVMNCGTIQRAGKGRTVSLITDQNERILTCHGTNSLIENFYFYSPDEVKNRVTKRLKKAAKKKNSTEATPDDDDLRSEASLSDEIKRLDMIRTKEKIKSIDIRLGANNELRIIANLANNSMHLYRIEINLHKKLKDIVATHEENLLRSITQCGHQAEVRCVSFSSDSLAIASGAGDSMKLWNRESMQCLRTIPADYVLTCCFVPGDRYVLLGLKSGKLLITDVSTGEVIEEIPAHEKEIWSICLLPDQQGCVTGSSDTTVKIMIFELIDNPSIEDKSIHSKVLSLLHKNTLKLDDAVLCVRITPDSKFIAVGLLDSTVKIFFLDSFKFYLSLYGHKLPVLCMDISYDSRLIATGSADRNCKIWGLDFGDCHRSLFAHDDSVMSVQFIPKTHLFFSCGKDGKIKMWDGDTFDKIITLPSHIGEAYCLTISSNGRFLATCGSDRTVRLYERTDEILILHDVQEEEREEMENRALATGEENSVPTLPGLKLSSRKTVGAEKGAESILECLEICKEYESDDRPELHPLMRAHDVKTPDDFLLEVLCRIRASDMEASLVLLPFSSVCEILERVPRLSEKRIDQMEIICKIVIFLFRIHQKPITSNQTLLPIIGEIIRNVHKMIVECRDTIGMNLQSMHLLQRNIEEREGIELFRDATVQARKKREQRQKKIAKRTFIAMR